MPPQHQQQRHQPRLVHLDSRQGLLLTLCNTGLLRQLTNSEAPTLRYGSGVSAITSDLGASLQRGGVGVLLATSSSSMHVLRPIDAAVGGPSPRAGGGATAEPGSGIKGAALPPQPSGGSMIVKGRVACN